MEEEVKRLIKESLNKRLVGHGDIDTFYPNHVLIEEWLTDIMALGYNDSDTELASQDIYEIKRMFDDVSIEEIRAFVSLVSYRFPEEIMAFTKYAELHEEEEESVVISAVKEELSFVEEGDFTLS
ncbi:MAG: hypothetical protein IKX61_07735 [Prevotella sp.]|nr:hypothetical protein [Prevotella sp.]